MKKSLFVAALAIVLLSWPRTAAAQCSTFGGRATVVQANALGVGPVVLSDTGNLDSTGGAKEASLLTASVPGLLAVEVMHASAIGQGNSSQSEASVANLSLTMAGNAIAADFLMARANATCGSTSVTVSGGADIAGLSANGQSIFVTGSPNQTVSLPGGVTIIINEQTGSVQGQNGSMTVNALHVTAPGVADAVISSASVSGFVVIGGGGGGGACQDFITGGGWITATNGAKGNFGVAGGIKNGAFWGHLEYHDHGDGTNVHGTGVTAYTVTGPTSRHIEGTAEVNGAGGFTYAVDVADNGEPGHGVDTFAITLSNGYSAPQPPNSPLLGGGNIQLHKPCS